MAEKNPHIESGLKFKMVEPESGLYFVNQPVPDYKLWFMRGGELVQDFPTLHEFMLIKARHWRCKLQFEFSNGFKAEIDNDEE